jgi:hypothetical protein
MQTMIALLWMTKKSRTKKRTNKDGSLMDQEEDLDKEAYKREWLSIFYENDDGHPGKKNSS